MKDEIVLRRAHIDHTHFTRVCILQKDPPPQCEHCQYYHHRTTLHVCRGRMNVIYYQDNVLRNHVMPFSHQHRDAHMLGGHRPSAQSTCYNTVSSEQECPLLEWTALSPYLSPVEHLWNYIFNSSHVVHK